MWYPWDEWARDFESSCRGWGVLYKSGVPAATVLGLTPGELLSATIPPGSAAEGWETGPDRRGAVSRGQSRGEAGKAIEALQSRKVEQTDRPSRNVNH